MARINSQAICKINNKQPIVDSFLYGWALINKLMKPHVTNRLEKGGLPNTFQVCLKMALKAPVTDMLPSPVIRQCSKTM